MTKDLEIKIKALAETPGIYIFKDESNEVIYVGKAKNLRSRVLSYLNNDLGTKTAQMVLKATYLETINVDSEVEALLLEAETVKKFNPKYNIQLKDDKSPIYIGITKEEFPRVVVIRKNQITKYSLKKLYGPYLSGLIAKRILKRIRKVFPFATHSLSKKACIYSQIGLCKPCPNDINNTKDQSERLKLKKIYNQNILKLEKTLSGKIPKVRNLMAQEMEVHSKNQDYEKARLLREQISDFDRFTNSFDRSDSYLSNPNLLSDIREKELGSLSSILSGYFKISSLNRIECFDIAHLSGTYPTASMVVLIDGEIDKRHYRHFRIANRNKSDDMDNMRDTISRRKNHFGDWGVPDLIIVDGGKGQLSVAKEVLGVNFPVIGLAKRYETLVFMTDKGSFSEYRLPDIPAKNLVQRIRDEAHRFARSYHHKLVAKALTKNVS